MIYSNQNIDRGYYLLTLLTSIVNETTTFGEFVGCHCIRVVVAYVPISNMYVAKNMLGYLEKVEAIV